MEVVLFNLYRKKFLQEPLFLDLIEHNIMKGKMNFSVNIDKKKDFFLYSKFFKHISVNFLSGSAVFTSQMTDMRVAERFAIF